MPARIVLLNGVSSVGKTSLARAIQGCAREAFLHVEMDVFLAMLPPASFGRPEGLLFEHTQSEGLPTIVVRSGPLVGQVLRGMRHSIAAMAGLGCNIVVDDVIFDDGIEEYRSLLAPFDFKVVGVFAPLHVLEERERARGDRAIGLARGQIDVVHKNKHYDFEVDTSADTAEVCARAIVERFKL